MPIQIEKNKNIQHEAAQDELLHKLKSLDDDVRAQAAAGILKAGADS
ncbi:hypothetical protein QUF75_17920 [Desulfococcaceae bacterium HSG7]|nr:hypothetical protein [Desulfococcaceae bacterium HSG7]